MRYFLAHNGVDIFHYGKLELNEEVITGQPNLEFFDNENDLSQRLSDLGQQFETF